MASQCYYEGDFWDATTSVAPGESPGTHPQKWRRLTIPITFRDYLVLKALMVQLAGAGQHEKAIGMRRNVEDALEEAVIREARTNGNGLGIQAFTR